LPRLFTRRVLIQSLIALTFDIGGILSGRMALIFLSYFEAIPWFLALFPPILSIRGNLGGIFAGNFSTMLHTGEVAPKLTGNTKTFNSLIKSVFFLTFVDTNIIGVLAFFINFFTGNATIDEILFFTIVPSVTCILAMTVALPIASLVGIIAFKRGIDPDILLYPAMSTIDDVIVTACYILVVSLVLTPQLLACMPAVMVIFGAAFLIILVMNRKDRNFKRILTEGGPMILFSSLLATFGGIGLASLREEIEKRPGVLIIYPALIDTLGDIGSILGSMLSTKLALGYATGFAQAFKNMFADLVSVEIAAAIMHVMFGVTAFLLGRMTGLTPELFPLISISIVTNLISFLFISVLSLLTAVETFKHGLDPDNFVIPVVTSVSDVGATLALMVSLAILRL